MRARLFRTFLLVFEGRFSLRLVVLATVALFWIVALLFAYMALYRLYHRLRADYRARRSLAYLPAIELVLLEEPFEKVLEALRPRRWGDASVVRELMVENMRHIEGPPFEQLNRCARDLGFIQADLRALRSPNKLRRGMALEALGVMRVREAVPDIVKILDAGAADIKLTALRALAAIGDPEALPHFLTVSDRLSPPMMVRLASLMMEFGAPAREWVRKLITRHPEAFNARTTALVLREITSREAQP